MKQNLFYASAFVTATFLVACASDDSFDDGKYDQQRGVVKTEFTISIPSKTVGNTRMTSDIVQVSSTDFRGIVDIHLYPFNAKTGDLGSTTELTDGITLVAGTTVATTGPSGLANNSIANSGALFANNNSHLYQDVEVPIGTKSFMFYGLAAGFTAGEEFQYGTFSENLSAATTLGAITFTPAAIYATGSVGSNGTAIATYLTSIARAAAIDGGVSHPWSASDNVVLKTLYERFITMKAGSWASVKGALQQLYTSLFNRTDAISAAIKTAITVNASVSDTDDDGVLEFAADAYGDYPADLNLPDGAAYVNWNADTFYAINFTGYDNGSQLPLGTALAGYYTKDGSNNYTACTAGQEADGTTTYYRKVYDNTGLDITNLSTYAYPAPLYYRALSNIRTAEVSKADAYSSQATWDGVIGEYGAEVVGTNDEVKYTTRSIALVNQIQYAVGRLDVTVKAQTATVKDYEETTFGYTHDESGTAVNNFPVTGVLIGNQRAVDYRFTPVSTVSPTYYTIYDKTIPTGICLNSTVSDAIHTLVYETPHATMADDPNAVVKIAVEFLNNSGQLFAGQDGHIIYPGTKFYLVGTFDPSLNSTTYYKGTTTPINQTFVQDYTTTANLVIASLKSAYNVMPDLRSPKLELGLSVDLTWEEGITQEIVIN